MGRHTLALRLTFIQTFRKIFIPSLHNVLSTGTNIVKIKLFMPYNLFRFACIVVTDVQPPSFFSYGGFRVCLSTLIVELGLGLTPSISRKKPRGCTLIA